MILHQDEPRVLQALVAQLLKSEERCSKILVVDNASESTDSNLVLDVLRGPGAGEQVTVVDFEAPKTWGACLNASLADVDSEFVAILPAGVIVGAGFLSQAAEALKRRPEYSGVVPTAAIVPPDGGLESPKLFVFRPIGEGYASAGIINRLVPHVLLFRTDVLRQTRWNEQLRTEMEWELMARLAGLGHRFLVWPELEVAFPEAVSWRLAFKDEEERRQNIEIIRSSVDRDRGCFGFPAVSMCDAEAHFAAGQGFAVPHHGGGFDEADLRELAIRRTAARKRAQIREGDRTGNALSILRSRVRFDAWLDEVANETSPSQDWRIESDAQVVDFQGWCRPLNSSRPNPDLTLVLSGASGLRRIQTSRVPRLDVAIAFDLPEDQPWGYEGRIARSQLTPGELEISVEFGVSGKIVGRKRLGRLLVG